MYVRYVDYVNGEGATSSTPEHKFWSVFADGLTDNDEKVASSKKHTQLKTTVQKLYSKIVKNWYPIYDQNGWKTLPSGAAHTCIAQIREYHLPPQGGGLQAITPQFWTWFKAVLAKVFSTQHK